MTASIPAISIPEVRDYGRINPELVRLLDEGHTQVRLVGAEGQRLLVAGLRGAWEAVVVIEGRAGPELAADLEAPGLTVVSQGSAADGAGRGMKAGQLLILGDGGDAVGYAQSGGLLLVAGSVGARAGLDQSGGRLILAGGVGRLAGERQRGGVLTLAGGPIGPHRGVGRSGGRVEEMGAGDVGLRNEVRAILGPWESCLPPGWLAEWSSI